VHCRMGAAGGWSADAAPQTSARAPPPLLRLSVSRKRGATAQASGPPLFQMNPGRPAGGRGEEQCELQGNARGGTRKSLVQVASLRRGKACRHAATTSLQGRCAHQCGFFVVLFRVFGSLPKCRVGLRAGGAPRALGGGAGGRKGRRAGHAYCAHHRGGDARRVMRTHPRARGPPGGRALPVWGAGPRGEARLVACACMHACVCTAHRRDFCGGPPAVGEQKGPQGRNGRAGQDRQTGAEGVAEGFTQGCEQQLCSEGWETRVCIDGGRPRLPDVLLGLQSDGQARLDDRRQQAGHPRSPAAELSRWGRAGRSVGES
jgi:hypothetical protein